MGFKKKFTCGIMTCEMNNFETEWSLCSALIKKKNPQWGAVDAEIKLPSVEKTELEGSPFKAWGKSVYSHACYVYCQGFLPR